MILEGLVNRAKYIKILSVKLILIFEEVIILENRLTFIVSLNFIKSRNITTNHCLD